jgi:hypothetical protein
VAQATGRATPARDECEQRFRATSASSGSARRVRAAVPRDECGQRFRATSADSGSARRVRATVPRDECEQRFRATSADRNESVIRGGARGTSARGESQTSGDARYERREGVRGRPNAAGRLAQKLPSPALKEAERSGSYNPGDLNTLTGGTVRSGTVQGQQREEQRTPCPVNLRGPERTRSGEARRVRDTDQGQESVLRRD